MSHSAEDDEMARRISADGVGLPTWDAIKIIHKDGTKINDNLFKVLLLLGGGGGGGKNATIFKKNM